MDKKYIYFKPLNVNNLKQAAIAIHLNYLHRVQLEMIDEAVNKSDLREAKEVIQHIMELKSEKKHSS
jgi:plasmid maintenance system killer protein